MIKVNVFIDGVETSIDRDLVPKDINGREVDYILSTMTNGIHNVDTVRQSVEDLKVATEKWKQERQIAVDNIEVNYNGVIYQGDETSQTRMSRAINALPDDVTTIGWVAKDNSVNNLTRLDLKAILVDAGNQQSVIWNEGRPV